jgi:hypothetical protein
LSERQREGQRERLGVCVCVFLSPPTVAEVWERVEREEKEAESDWALLRGTERRMLLFSPRTLGGK